VLTEIYICKEGQALKDGKLEMRHDITHRDDAETDAIRRCGIDRSIHKVAYYALSESGDFRLIFTYTNPTPVSAGAKLRQASSRPPKRKKKSRQAAKAKTLIEKIAATFKGD
jgi:hypothetical protein